MAPKKIVNRNPRVAVSFSPEVYELLVELSDLLKQPKSALVSELVSEALPALRLTVLATRLVQEQPKEAERLMANYAARATLQMSQAQVELYEAIDQIAKGEPDGTP